MMKIYLKTERIFLQEFSLEYKLKLMELDSDPEVMKYINGGIPTPLHEIESMISRITEILQKHNGKMGAWVATEKSANTFIGWFFLRPAKHDPTNLKILELGYRLKKQFWGLGYATEVSKKLMQIAFDHLNADEVFALTDKENIGSRKVMEKLGLVYSHEYLEENSDLKNRTNVFYSKKNKKNSL